MRIHSPFLMSCLALALLLPASAVSQVTVGGERPVVGVALSGGSALGLAHIGVIRYFEEHHIPIDRIGGTSMGGLIGGLYASGMDSAQITTVAERADWSAILNPSTPFADQPVVDKQNWSRTFGKMTLRFGKGFSLPSGLNSGEALSLLLSHLTLAYSGVSNFDELPTPFRCVATDLVSGDAVVLAKGSLPLAMRATMSLPGVFTPVKLDKMVLVDGGVLENIPVDPVRSMGAQTVIAVALETPNATPEQFKSLPSVLRQTVSIAIAKNEQRSLAKADLVISVDTSRFSAADYGHWKDIIEAGYRAAKAHAADLERFELSPEEWDSYLAKRHARTHSAEPRGRLLAVSSPNASFQKNAQAELDRTLGSRVVPEHELETVLSGMVAATAVPGAAYEWQQEGVEGKGGYNVRFAERPNDQVLVRVSGLYAVSAGEPTRFGIRLSTITIPRNAYKARLLATYNLGYDPGFQGEAFKPFGSSQFFVASQVIVTRTHFNSYTGATRQSDTRDRFAGAIYFGAGTWRFAQLRFGLKGGYDSYSRPVVVDGVASRSGGFTIPEARWILNTQDSGGLPTRGTRAEGSAGYIIRSHEYPFLQNDFSTFRPISSRITLFATNHAATSFGRKLGYFDQFTAGEQTDMAAFRYQEFHANSLLTAGSGLIFYGHRIPHVSAHPGFAVWYEAGRFDMGSHGWATHQSTSLGVLFPTQVGATGLQLSFDEAGRARFRLMLGSF